MGMELKVLERDSGTEACRFYQHGGYRVLFDLHLWDFEYFPRAPISMGRGLEPSRLRTCGHFSIIHRRRGGKSSTFLMCTANTDVLWCGIIIESKAFRELFARYEDEPSVQSHESVKSSRGLRPGYSINPIPAMTLFVLGIILGGHHQSSMQATMMHTYVSQYVNQHRYQFLTEVNQVGNLLMGGAAARCITYLLICISPPASTSPTRPPTELISAFCLISGGVMLMSSVRIIKLS